VRELCSSCAVLYKEQEKARLARIGSPTSLKALENLKVKKPELFV
jgi:hypothetical protein